jgi:hypothetical protein
MTNGSQEQRAHAPSADAGRFVADRSAGALRAGTPLAQGTSFETAVHEVVGRFAAAWGDGYIDTARSSGLIGRCRKGDGVLIIHGQRQAAEPARVVLEMTTEEGTRREWDAYLEEAERNRAAQASLGVVPSTIQVPGRERIRMFGTSRMVIAFDPDHDEPDILRTVLHLLRSQAITAASRRGTACASAAEEKLAEAIELLDQLNTLHSRATIACASVDKVAADLTALHSRLYRTLIAASQDLEEVGIGTTVPPARPGATASITLEGSPQ